METQENSYKATALYFQSTADECEKFRQLLKARRLKFKSHLKVGFQSYAVDFPVITILSEYVEDFVNHMTGVYHIELIKEEPVFRASDYIFAHRGNYYRISVPVDGIESQLGRYIETYKLDFDPPYQRGYVWTKKQKVKFIEHLLSGNDSGKEIYFNCPDWMGSNLEIQNMQVVDGKQRLEALRGFISGNFKVFDVAEYKDLTWEDKSKLGLYFNINNLLDERDVVRWYLSMNTGGTVHTEKDLDVARDYLEQLTEED